MAARRPDNARVVGAEQGGEGRAHAKQRGERRRGFSVA